MATSGLRAIAGTALGLALLLPAPPSPAEAQERRPSIRIGGGHVHIGGRHVGFTGTRRDPHAAGLLIRDRLHRLGDPRARRFGPHRLRSGRRHLLGPEHRHLHHLRRHPRFRHPRQRQGHHHLRHRLLFHPHGHGLSHLQHHDPHHHLRHHPGHLIVVFVHPLGSVALVSHLSHTRAVRTVGTSVTVGRPAGGGDGNAGAPAEPGFRREARAAAPGGPPPFEPPPPDRCADVTVFMLAGVAQTVRLDVRSLGAESVEEADEFLHARLASGGGLLLRGAYGDGLAVPVSMVRRVMTEACPAPSGGPEP